MSEASQERRLAEQLPPGSVVSVLLEQHAKIRELFARTAAANGGARQRAFDELRELLAVHEAGEEVVVRPQSKNFEDGKVAQARNAEEKQAASALAALEKLDVEGAEFAEKLAALESDVSAHAYAEENGEFNHLISSLTPEKQLEMGSRLLEAQRNAPTHPHPTAAGSPAAVKAVGPFAALLDKARDTYAEKHGD